MQAQEARMSPIEFKTVKASMVQMPDGSTTIGIYSTPSVRSTMTTPERTPGVPLPGKVATAPSRSPLRDDVFTNRQLLFAHQAAQPAPAGVASVPSVCMQTPLAAAMPSAVTGSMMWQDLSPHAAALTPGQALHSPDASSPVQLSTTASVVPAHSMASTACLRHNGFAALSGTQLDMLRDNAAYAHSTLSSLGSVASNAGRKQPVPDGCSQDIAETEIEEHVSMGAVHMEIDR